ncbi:MAG: c-type cytochrome, partial [Gammaproteobacteria bacterium]|nr:c-type cytochrome [Gammaproteobacteria bacterium]
TMKAFLTLLVLIPLAPQTADAAPDWAYPKFDPNHPPSGIDANAPRNVPGSDRTYTLLEIDDDLNPPVWFPDDNPPMPAIVIHSEEPVKACTACHMASGMGHPQSGHLAGLPVEYFIKQMADFKSGLRKDSAGWMNKFAAVLSDDDVRAAAEYFAALTPRVGWFELIESESVPKSYIGESRLRLRVQEGGEETLGDRIVVLAQNEEHAISKHPYSGFYVYAPPGSIAQGEYLVTTGGGGKTVPCAACHGPDLKGIDNVPRIRGIDPIYLVRQLFDFQSGDRAGPLSGLMKPSVDNLSESDMVAIAAYLASLEPAIASAIALPTDDIPWELELPDPCNNATTRMWGADDQLGNLNYLTAERVQQNLGLIRLGIVYELSHPLDPGQMGFKAHLDTKSNLGQWPGKNGSTTIFNNEELIGNSTYNPKAAGSLLTSLGTQFDGFTHTTQSGITYNCFNTRDPAYHRLAEGDPGDLPNGMPGDDYVFRGHARLGMENIGTLVARAILVDLATPLRERERSAGRDPEQFPPFDYEFSPEEIEMAMVRQGLTFNDIKPGDAILFRTGWAGRYWTSNPSDPRDERLKYLNGGKETFGPAGPGLDARAIQWSVNRMPVLVGGDNKSVEATVKKPRFKFENFGHLSWLNNGIYMMEDLDLEEYAEACEKERAAQIENSARPDKACYISTLIVSTLPIKGNGGSPVAPILIR